MGAGLTLLKIWANTGTRTTPSDAKINQGWVVGEQPAADWWNEREYVRDSAINDVITYLNTGIPLSDLLAGTVTLSSSSSMQFLGSSTTDLDAGGLAAYTTDDRCQVQPEGLRFISEEGSEVKDIHPLAVSLTSATWTSLGGTEYQLDQTIEIPDLEWLTDQSGIYFTGSVIGYSSGTSKLYSLAAHQLEIEDTAGGVQIKNIVINSTFNPSGFTNPRFVFGFGIADSLIPSGI